ncbi:YkyA family protein [Paenibacillus urinalis]|uniref:YkyA family protein n=1 Tax=Paenibacillus urinalis TaxID=521520 RepID=A0ABY7XF73_9BACL|nr:YkyA family protein [Paenibacillus urinalis]WDH99573.1 YkyA family protein [Paenibacillus urinalis]WDI03207.1 YkyA family protein [Paenibacillus urinalis]
MVRGRLRKLALFFMSIIMLTACSKGEATSMVHAIETTVQTENQMHSNLNQLAALEEEDMVLYEAILDQGREENKEQAELLDQAQIHVKERNELLHASKSIMDAAEIQSERWEEELSVFRNSKVSEGISHQAEELWADYQERQRIFDQLYTQYELALQIETELYALLEEKGSLLSITELKAKVAERNLIFAEVNEIKNEFNEATKAFNNKHQAVVAEIKALL